MPELFITFLSPYLEIDAKPDSKQKKTARPEDLHFQPRRR